MFLPLPPKLSSSSRSWGRSVTPPYFALLLAVLLIARPGAARPPAPAPVSLTVDLTKPLGPMTPMWAYFGYDEPNYTYMKDGQQLLTELAALSPAPVYVRVHNLLTTGDGTAVPKWGSTNAYTEDKKGRPVYDWRIVDRIFDAYVSRGMKPLAQLGFMPEALSTHPQPYRHHWSPGQQYENIFTGWAYPPTSYQKWGELAYQWVRHCVARYGAAEVNTWRWELWNEPDIPYWKGTPEEYQKLYDYTEAAVHRALPTAVLGGPETTSPHNEHAARFLRDFLEHCVRGKNYASGQTGTRLDFVSFHAKGSPRVVADHVRMNMGVQLRDAAEGFRIVTSFPELKELPIIIGENDPEGCAACPQEFSPQNAYRNGTMYSSYTAAAYAHLYALADQYHARLAGAVSWSFEFEDQPWFAGFRDLATNGVDKPVLNVFRMLGLMGGQRVAVANPTALPLPGILTEDLQSQQPDISALATLDTAAHAATVLVWHYHNDDLPAPPAAVALTLRGLPAGRVLVQHYRVDQTHGNAYAAWQQLGSPQTVSEAQRAALEKAGQLTLLDSPAWVSTQDGQAALPFALPRQGVSLVKVSW